VAFRMFLHWQILYMPVSRHTNTCKDVNNLGIQAYFVTKWICIKHNIIKFEVLPRHKYIFAPNGPATVGSPSLVQCWISYRHTMMISDLCSFWDTVISTGSTPTCLKPFPAETLSWALAAHQHVSNCFQPRHCHERWQHTNMSQNVATETLS